MAGVHPLELCWRMPCRYPGSAEHSLQHCELEAYVVQGRLSLVLWSCRQATGMLTAPCRTASALLQLHSPVWAGGKGTAEVLEVICRGRSCRGTLDGFGVGALHQCCRFCCCRMVQVARPFTPSRRSGHPNLGKSKPKLSPCAFC